MREDRKRPLQLLRFFFARCGIECGTSLRGRKSGADLYVRMMQGAALLPAVYLLLLSGYPALAAGKNLPAFLFETGISALPRAEVYLLACLYRRTARETLLHMALLITALAFGLIADRLLHGYGPHAERNARVSRILFAALIAADLLVRLQPFFLQIQTGTAAFIIGSAVRCICLLLVLADLAG